MEEALPAPTEYSCVNACKLTFSFGCFSLKCLFASFTLEHHIPHFLQWHDTLLPSFINGDDVDWPAFDLAWPSKLSFGRRLESMAIRVILKEAWFVDFLWPESISLCFKSIHWSLRQPITLPVNQSLCLFVWLFVCVWVCLSVSVSASVSVSV